MPQCSLIDLLLLAMFKTNQPIKETMKEKKYNNIQDVSLVNLYKMLTLKQFQDKDHQKMINDEINFRNNPITLNQLENLFKGQLVKLSKVL